jgi:hypothetical protein
LYARRYQRRAASHVLVAEATIAAFASALASDIAVGIASQRRTGMPRILVRSDLRDTVPNFTVDRAVGRNAPNDRLDVLFVQVHLMVFTQKPNWKPAARTVPSGLRVATPVFRQTTVTPTHPKPAGSIVIDGICGNQTIGFIEYFQEQMQLAGVGVELNGQVAPLGTMGTTTMWLLNETMPWGLGIFYPGELRSCFYYD